MAQAARNLHTLSETSNVVQPAPLTEPVVITSAFITGGAVCVAATDVRLIGWEALPSVAGETEERRIMTRIVMSTDTAREIAALLRNALTKGGH